MKKKILTMLVLLIAAVTGAWADNITVYFTDAQNYGDVNVYYWPEGGDWPGTAMTFVETNDLGQNIYSAVIPAGVTGIIFNGNGRQTADITENIADGAWWYSTEATDDQGHNYVGFVGTYIPDIEVTQDGNNWSFAMPDYDLELEVEYFPRATLSAAPVAAEGLNDGTIAALLTAGSSAEGTLSYALSESDTEAPTTGWSTDVPTTEDIAAGTYYVWYKVVGDAEHSDSEPQCIGVTIAAIPAYAVTIEDGDVNTDKWEADPEQPKAGQTVTLKYNGKKKVRSITIEKREAAFTLSKSSIDFGDAYKGSTETFTVTRDGDGEITATSSNTDFATVSVSGTTVTVTRNTFASGSATITVSVAATTNYTAPADQTCTVSSESLSRHLGMVQAEDKGKYLGADGYIYPTIAAATNADTEARAVIAYVGAVTRYWDHCLCIALEDASGPCIWGTAKTACDTWAASHAVSLGGNSYNTSHDSYDIVQNDASASSQTRNEGIGYGWRIPNVTDWRYIMEGFGGASATSPAGVAMGAYGNTVRSAINTACGNTGIVSAAYWTCSTQSGTSGESIMHWGVHFDNGDHNDVFWTYNTNPDNPNLRLVFAW